MNAGVVNPALVGPSDLVMLISVDRKQFIFRLQDGGEMQTNRGVIRHAALVGVPWGSTVHTHLGQAFFIIEPSLHDLLLYMKRRSQIIFPKDIGYLLLRLSIGPGKTVIEAGTGSGGLTTALAWAVGPTGHVFSYDRRADMQDLARKNLERVGLADHVSLLLRDIAGGFDQTGVDAIFLDLPDPHSYLAQVTAALRNGGSLGAILPTTNQVSDLLAALEREGFGYVEVCEILLRFYKTVAARLRPNDRMVAHTGYLVFARSLLTEAPPPMATSELGEGEAESET
jgi:tRNA (adenine57-N1/adenine58-N1)-methyltransferase